mmetsp:Transcript_42305/g.79214  ORF Transcript_42305/g.79214 Transcript_42305/m.79214 type:complete len:672 (-) Transcript_42305:57-2072(-)
MNSVVLHPILRKPSGSHAVQTPLCIFSSQKLLSALLLFFLASRSHALGTSGSDSNSNWNGVWYASQLGRRVGRHGIPFSIKVKTSNHNAPRDYENATSFYNKDVNVLTVAIRSAEPIGLIKLSLPARQQCYAKGQVCAGYAFVEGRDPVMQRQITADKSVQRPDQVSLCDLEPVSNIGSMKSDSAVLDVLSENMIEVCTVNNKVGDYEARAKRSLMKLYLKDEPVRERNTWLVFQIKVRNPPQTPVKLDDEGRMANTFQVILKSQGGSMFLGSRVIPAGRIFSIWTCGYSKWIRSSTCTASCGGGVRYRVRRLLHPPPPGYPVELLINCSQSLTEMESCNPQPCDQDCQLGEWTSFTDGDCSVTCGTGTQVERRRIVQGPMGKGKLCPDWDEHEVRVRLRPCEMGACETPRCELASADDMNGYLATKCSQVCGPDATFQTLPVAVLKEQSATMKTCGQEWQTLPCPERPCGKLNFVPYDWSKLPKLDTWIDMEMAFTLNDMAQVLQVSAPDMFQLGADKTGRCILKEHNLPRLKECVVSESTTSQSSMTFLFLNPLEGTFWLKDGSKKQISFKVRLWIKPPPACAKGLDSTGACIVDSGEWDWVMKADFKDEGEEQMERLTGSFKVYDPKVKTSDVHGSSAHGDVRLVSTAPQGSFVQLHSWKRRQPSAST